MSRGVNYSSLKACVRLFKNTCTLFGTTGGSKHRVDSNAFLHHLPGLTARDPECCERPIITAILQDAISGFARDKLPCLDGMLHEIFCLISDLLEGVLAALYNDWEQNENIPVSVKRGAMPLLKRDRNKVIFIDNVTPTHWVLEIHADSKIWINVLAERFEFVIKKLVHKAETCVW